MARRNKSVVGVGLFEKKKDAGLPKHPLAQSGTAIPTDKKSETLGAHSPRNSKRNYKKQAK